MCVCFPIADLKKTKTKNKTEKYVEKTEGMMGSDSERSETSDASQRSPLSSCEAASRDVKFAVCLRRGSRSSMLGRARNATQRNAPTHPPSHNVTVLVISQRALCSRSCYSRGGGVHPQQRQQQNRNYWQRCVFRGSLLLFPVLCCSLFRRKRWTMFRAT